MGILCQLKNLNLTLGAKNIFNRAEFTLHENDRIGLIGLNGQGKSTLFRVLMGELGADESDPVFSYEKRKKLFRFFHVPQELPLNEFQHLGIPDFYLAFYPELYAISRQIEDLADTPHSSAEQATLWQELERRGAWELQNRYENYLKSFDLQDFSRPLTKLSGGEKRKIALALGLSTPCEVVLWDEPTNHLDLNAVNAFEEEMQLSNKTFMMISHDRYLLDRVTQRTVHIHQGKIHSFSGSYGEYMLFQNSVEQEKKKNLEKLYNNHRQELAWMRQGIKARGTRSKKRVESFHNLEDKITQLRGSLKQKAKIHLGHSGKLAKKLIEIKQGSFHYPEKEIFKELNLNVMKDMKIALMGSNGVGKSTLLKILKDELQLSSGTIKRAENLNIIVFSQERESLPLGKTPLEIIGDGVSFVTLRDGREIHVRSYLKGFLFTPEQMTSPIDKLSGGEKNRLQLAAFMKQAADLWVFDEPTNDLDIETIELLEQELKNYAGALIIVSHDRSFLDAICDSAWVFHQQSIEVFEGSYSHIAPYLQALEEKKKLSKNSTPPGSAPSATKTPQKKKMTHAEKKRWEVIEDDLEKNEIELKTIEEQLASFDFSLQGSEHLKKYQELVASQEKLKEEQEKLYHEWEYLSSFFS